MTMARYFPQWVRTRPEKSIPQKSRILSKKDWQILPTLPKSKDTAIRLQDDNSRAGFRVL